MQVERARAELLRLVRQRPFQTFMITLKGGERAIVQHPENMAFSPVPGSATDFYARTEGVRLHSTFEAMSSISVLADAPAEPEHDEELA